MLALPVNAAPTLSVCIATLNRAPFLHETLSCVVAQLTDAVELVIVDGASTDNTETVVEQFQNEFPNVRYFKEATNSGVDADYDKAVGYARGAYCWLMTDDDLLKDGAIDKVLRAIELAPELIVVNAELRSRDFAIEFSSRMLPFQHNRSYDAARAESEQLEKNGDSGDREKSEKSPAESETLFVELASYMSFIGCTVFKRQFWMSRNREAYYGSLFIHIGVAFQYPVVANVYVVSTPLIVVRYGNAMWTPRRFEIWMFMWPRLLGSFTHLSPSARQQIVEDEPWRSAKTMLQYKAMGGYGLQQYEQFIRSRTSGLGRLPYYLLSVAPSSFVGLLAVLACLAAGARKSPELYDISLAPSTGRLGRWLANWCLQRAS